MVSEISAVSGFDGIAGGWAGAGGGVVVVLAAAASAVAAWSRSAETAALGMETGDGERGLRLAAATTSGDCSGSGPGIKRDGPGCEGMDGCA